MSGTIEVKKTTLITFGVMLVFVMIYIYWYHVRRLELPTMSVDDCSFKTGDLILFRTTQNFNSLKMINYFTHCGIVIEIEGRPHIFESTGIDYNSHILPHHNPDGIFITPLKERIQKYKGYCYWKQLEKPLTKEQIDTLTAFANYALDNFHYDRNIFGVVLQNALGLRQCSENTNCGETCFLALIAADLIDESEYDKWRLHYLKYVCEIRELKNNSYLPLVQIVDHPFAE